MTKTDIKSMEYEELKEFVTAHGQPGYRAGQLFSWMHKNCVSSFEEMTNLPKDYREYLSENCTLSPVEKYKVLVSKIDGTRKYLFRLKDGLLIESVMMKYRHGNSVCVSSQAGCAMGCLFCASTRNGLERNLKASEMLGQVYEIQKDCGERISNVVVMGMGEPLANYENTVRFVRILSDEKGLHVSRRNITISTCGIVPAIIKLGKENLKVTLALSLHAPDDTTRKSIMPVAEKYSLAETLKACDEYFRETGRRVTFEYCLLGGINDSPEHARLLALKLAGMSAHVNLIPVNPVPEIGVAESREKDIRAFREILEKSGIAVTRRREMGRDINGACGQLRLRETGDT